MKKTIALFTLSCLLLLSACSSGSGQAVPPQSVLDQIISDMDADNSSSDADNVGSSGLAEAPRILVAYFTMPDTSGVDAVVMASRVVVDGELMGNTQVVANVISKNTGGELFAIETIETYPTDHDELTEYADEEQAQDARPELATHIENPDDYDIIFIGYPNWWGDFPMPLYTFLEVYDFTGKTLIPFNTHGGSRFSNTINVMGQLQPNANVTQDGFTVSRNDVADAEVDIIAWLEGLDMI